MTSTSYEKRPALNRLADDTRAFNRAQSQRHSSMRQARVAGATWREIAATAGCSEATARRMVGS